jgi:hemerythrin-like domain-containing protein
MSTNITHALVDEHRLILRMIALLEKNAPATAAGSFRDWQFYLDAVDFVRNYADRYHHAKEEDVLFEALVANGMPRQNSPVAAMLMEHDHGRAFVAAMEAAAREALAGKEGQGAVIAENALAYAELLRGHIEREDTILYPLAERVVSDALRPGIIAGYESAETRTPDDFADRYRAMVERYEAA